MSTKHVYFFGGKSADGNGKHEGTARRQGRQPRRDVPHRHPRPARLHDHDRGLRRLLRAGQEDPRSGDPADRRGASRRSRARSAARSSATRPTRCSSRVRSGAALSMPGMMNTILNLGLTDASVEGLAKKTGNPRFAYDSYRRLIDMFGSTAMGVEHEDFEHEIHPLKDAEEGQARHRPLRGRPQGTREAVQGRLQEARRRRLPAGPDASSSCSRSTPSSTPGTARRRSSIAASSASRA